MTEDSFSKPSTNRRSVRNIIIHRPMQREFTIITIVIMMISAVFTNYLIQNTLEEIISNNVTGFGKIGAYNVLSDASFELIVRVTLVMFVTIITVGIFGVFFLHRVAGPVYRFHQFFQRFNRDGEIPSEFSLRNKDFFKESAAELNAVFKVLRKRKDIMGQVEKVVSNISEKADSQELKSKLSQIKAILDENKQ